MYWGEGCTGRSVRKGSEVRGQFVASSVCFNHVGFRLSGFAENTFLPESLSSSSVFDAPGPSSQKHGSWGLEVEGVKENGFLEYRLFGKLYKQLRHTWEMWKFPL